LKIIAISRAPLINFCLIGRLYFGAILYIVELILADIENLKPGTKTSIMSTNSFPYPPGPQHVPANITEPSAAFKKEVSGVMGSILLFLIVYIILFLAAVGLAIACVAAGVFVMVSIRNLWMILIGIGLIGVGIMVLIFLVKFLFAVSRFDRSGSIEITEEEQPKLFAFIRQLTKETQTPFPKRIYLSPDVNACVFYDSSFWSMFLPVKKNLQIGLGLVNAVNLSEFKAVMAHEFGHFSQRSMKLGSFVYQVNRVIHNMLFDNNSYASFLRSWASVSDTFAFFAGITAHIVRGIQWVLQKMYGVVNKSYMRLSREMEFHADAVAASVSGGNNCISALQRIELAASGYNIVIAKYDELFKEKLIGKNVYENHRLVLRHLAREFNLDMKDDLPIVSREFLDTNNFSRINFKDQWASHPTMEEREAQLLKTGAVAETDHQSAWIIFSGKEELQEALTTKIYQHVTIAEGAQAIDDAQFKQRYLDDEVKFTLPPRYKGFYNGRTSTILYTGEAIAKPLTYSSFEEIFSAEHTSLPKKIQALEGDIALLKAMEEKQIDGKTFDFDGRKMSRNQATEVREQLEKELADKNKLLGQLDEQAFIFFYRQAEKKSGAAAEELRKDYDDYYRLRRSADEYLQHANVMFEGLRPIFAGETQPVEAINAQIAGLKEKHEPEFKKRLSEWMELGAFTSKEKIEKFIQSNYAYFSGSSFFDNELAELNELVQESWQQIYFFLFAKFKAILEKQLEYLPAQ